MRDAWDRGRAFSFAKMTASRRREIARMGAIAKNKTEAEAKWKKKHEEITKNEHTD